MVQPQSQSQDTPRDRVLRCKSFIATIRMACLYKMSKDPDFFDLSETVEMVEFEMDSIAEEMEQTPTK